MKGLTSADGKMTGNVQSVGSYDKSKKQPHESPSGGDSGGVHDPSGHDEIKEVVNTHGAADTHVITKNHQGTTGKEVHSETHHKSGHIHHADHASLDEAHEHGKVAMEDAEHNEMGDDAMEDAGERGGMEDSKHTSHAPFMT